MTIAMRCQQNELQKQVSVILHLLAVELRGQTQGTKGSLGQAFWWRSNVFDGPTRFLGIECFI
jgi:hypothetical protein